MIRFAVLQLQYMTKNNFQKNKYYRQADSDLMTVIIVCTGPGNIGSPFKKYHNVPKTGPGFDKFIAFAAKFPGLDHINFYEKVKRPGQTRGEFIRKIDF